jgi:outer membrane lipoprotein carrier protein
MNALRRYPVALVCALIVATLSGGTLPRVHADEPSAADLLARVQAVYADATDVKGTFVQEVTNVTFGRTATARGRLWLRRPGKMRWEYQARPRRGQPAAIAKVFVSNGVELYLVDHENQQIVKRALADNLLPSAITFLAGTGDLAADFKPSLDTSGTYGTRTERVLLLTPRVPSPRFQKLYLVIDPATAQVRRTILIDAGGNTNRFTFSHLDLAAKNADFLFEVDLRNRHLKAYRLVEEAPATEIRR